MGFMIEMTAINLQISWDKPQILLTDSKNLP